MCKKPRLIKHPSAEYHLRHADSIYINGSQSFVSDVYSLLGDLNTYISQHFSLSDLSLDEIYLTLCNNSYILWRGRRFPLFLRLRCGTCSECRYIYKKEIENRALIEASESSHVFFYTLTYDDVHLTRNGLNKPDVVAAFKRLRQHIDRYLGFPVKFTQFYVGEYGTDPSHSLRPHYHGLIFVENQLTPKQILEFFDLFSIYKSDYSFKERRIVYRLGDFYSEHSSLCPWWYKGMRIDIQSARNVSALVRYVCKYVTKGFSVNFKELLIHRERFEQHSNPLFVQLPKSRGLGCAHIERYKDAILNSRNGCISINVHGSIERIKIPNIFLTKLFPSLGSVCPNACYYYKTLVGILDILHKRPSFLSNIQLRHIIDFQRFRIDCLDYLKYTTLRRSQRTHLDISLAFYREMSDYELIEISCIILDFLDVAFDLDSYDTRCLMYSDFQERLHSNCPCFDPVYIKKKTLHDVTSDLDYIVKNMKFSFFDSIV